MAKMTGGEAVVRSLISEGVDVAFGIPSMHSIAIFDSLYSHPELRHITTRHEQGAATMADGYARASGKPGVCISSTGPGACNTITAMGEAHYVSSPVINITTQVESRLISLEKVTSHEFKDQLDVFRPVTGWNKRVESIRDIPPSIHEAFWRIRTQRPRPIELEFPTDILSDQGEVDIMGPYPFEKASGNPAKVAKAAACLASSKRPVIWAGGGAISAGAGAEIARLAELLQAPVLTSGNGKTIISSDHPLYLGRLAMGWGARGTGAAKSPVISLLEESDVVLGVGTKFYDGDTLGWTLPLPDQLIHIDIDERQFGKNYPYKVGIAGDARIVLQQLLKEMGKVSQKPSRAAEVKAIKAAVYQRAAQRAPEEMQMVEDIRDVAGPSAFLSLDVTAARYWVGSFGKVFEPRTEVSNYGFSGLGWAFPAGIGAKVACPDRPVVILSGDGSFMFTSQELATAIQFGINIVLVIFNDNSYGSIKEKQKEWCGGRYIAESLRNPDFVKFAQAFGAAAVEVPSLAGLKSALKKALTSGTTSVIVVPKALISSTADRRKPSPLQLV